MLKAIAPLLLAFGIVVATPVGAAAGPELDLDCHRAAVTVTRDLNLGLTVCIIGS